MLTDSQCRSAKCKDKPYKLTDANGLYLEVKPNGVKAWRHRFKLTKAGETKENLFTIGEYASAPPGETAEQAKARRDWEEVTKARRLDMLQRVVFPKIGGLRAKQVTPANVLDVLKTALKKSGPSVAAEAKRTMSAVFELAVSTLRAESDPVYLVRKALPANKSQHKRPLTTEEIGLLRRQLDGYNRHFQTVSVFRLMWLTCRPNEAIGAQWKEIDLDGAIWRIPPERMKKRKEPVVPLPRQAVEVLRAIHGVTGGLAHVFPHRDDRTKPMTDASLRQALNQLGWGGKYSPHATRTTGSTRLNEMGFSPDWIERQLAHAEPNVVRRTYNHADYLADRTKMMQYWADMLDACKAGAKVLPLRASAG